MLSSQFLISQKKCCGNGCRMCPYEPLHIKGNTTLQKRWNISEKNPYTTIMNKINIPMIGLGTWLIPNEQAELITKDAINLGYKHIDTAEIYRNEEGVGNALKSLSVQRDDIYITTKMWPGMSKQDEPYQTFDGAIKACEQSLKSLQLDEIDLYLIHNPFAKDNRLELWEAMVELKKQGKVKHVGVSNYNVHHIQEIEESGIEMPSANQIEIHPWHVIPTELAQYMDKHEILPIAYSTLAPIPNWREGSRWNGKPEDMKSGSMPCQDIADNYNVTVPQLFLKWAIQLGYPVLPKSVKYDRLKENLELNHFEISREDIKKISKIAKDNQKCLAWSGDFDPLEVE
ncbi:MAG: aldo/keto reductase [Candidatus Pelagibacter sp. TMED118]|nr:MAG: aldo/keto reductase [Candidatus Pelagibacter sp. TMED118]|tara:strand:+ start:3444 stop:4472 length:1029 start_codon:yes stop_codon:yes gene_type:complete